MMKFNGNKTYMTVAVIVMIAIGGYLSGDYTVGEAVNQILVGLGIAGIRHGVEKTK